MPHAAWSIVAMVMRSKSGQCWDPEKETYSKSRTSGGSEMTRLEHPPLNRPLRRKLRPNAKAFACAAIAVFGFAAGTPNAREVSKQPGLREILAALAAGRNVSARVSLPL
jgi:hypothetical protein